MAEKMMRHWPDPAGCMHAWVLAGPRLHVAMRDDVSCICLMHVSCIMYHVSAASCRELYLPDVCIMYDALPRQLCLPRAESVSACNGSS